MCEDAELPRYCYWQYNIVANEATKKLKYGKVSLKSYGVVELCHTYLEGGMVLCLKRADLFKTIVVAVDQVLTIEINLLPYGINEKCTLNGFFLVLWKPSLISFTVLRIIPLLLAQSF